MPKKKSAYWFFFQDFKEEQRLKGITYTEKQELDKDADKAWRSLPPSVRAKYEQTAKNEKEKNNAPVIKFASNGVPLTVIENRMKEHEMAQINEVQDITNIIKTKSFNQEILDEYFYIIDVNSYCKWDDKYLIGECTVLRFNLRNGIRDYYPVLINPGEIPMGYASDVRVACIELGLDMPDAESPSNTMDILANIIDFLRQKDLKAGSLPPLFTMSEKVLPTKSFLEQMCYTAHEDEMIFRVYRLEKLLFHLVNSLKSDKYDGLPHESLALEILKKDCFRYSEGLACRHHAARDKATECTDSRVFRWAYSIMDECCAPAGITPRSGTHVPKDMNIEKYKLLRNPTPRATVAGYEAAPSSSNTTANDSMWEGSFEASLASEPSGAWGEPSGAWGEPSGSQAASAWPQPTGIPSSETWPQLPGSGPSSAWPLPSGSQSSNEWPGLPRSQSSRARGQHSGSGRGGRESECVKSSNVFSRLRGVKRECQSLTDQKIPHSCSCSPNRSPDNPLSLSRLRIGHQGTK
ncbi:hypothetical protein SFRURICE_015550 [Spodoptera frugiperda]|nr:hypothetical protein SFRURICE_015550 [Spodoptera frugiperda]